MTRALAAMQGAQAGDRVADAVVELMYLSKDRSLIRLDKRASQSLSVLLRFSWIS
jgi:hypothetical protein